MVSIGCSHREANPDSGAREVVAVRTGNRKIIYNCNAIDKLRTREQWSHL